MYQPTTESDSHLILIVDDNPASLDVKSRWLNREGYRVIEATNGTDALALATVERPALILLDVLLPDMNGFEVCERLKAKPETSHIKVLQISAVRRSSPDRVKRLEVGADAYLIEPVEEEELLGTVRALLKLAQQEQSNRRLIEKLSQTERQLLDATEAAQCGIWDWDIATGKLEWFGEYEQLTGVLPDGFSGKIQAFVDVLHPDDRDRVWQTLQDLMARRETQYADEYRFIHPDGTVRWMNGTGRLYYDEHGQAICMTGVVQDITEQKQTEAILDLRALQQQALAALGMVVLRQRSFQNACNLAVECIVRTLDVELCKVLELLPSGQEVLLRAGIGWQEGLVGRATVSAGMHSQAGYTLEADKAVIVEDMRTETRFSGPPLLHDHGVVSGMSCIILGAEDRPWGVLGAHTTSLRRFTKDDVAFLQGVANVLAGAIQREEAEAESIRLAAIVHSSEDAIISQDRDGVMTSWNGGAERLYGYSTLEAVGQSITLIIPSERQDDEAHIRALILIGKQVERYDAVRRCKDGRLLDVSLTISPIKNDGGEIIGVSTIARDITERKRVEETLRASEARLEGLVISAMDAVIAIDAEQRIVLFNPAAERMFGCRSSDVVGSAIDRFIPETFRAAHRRHVQQFSQAGTTARQMGALGTISGLRANGEEFPIEASISQMVAAGKPLYTVILRDITERKKAEEALRESEERLRSILNRAPAAIFIKDPAGRYLFMNEQCAQVLSVNREQALGRTDRDFLSPELAAEFMANDQRVWESDRLITVKERVPQADGVHISLVQKFLLRDSQGRPYALSGIALDITPHLQLEATIQASEARLQLAQSAANIGVFDWDIAAQNGVWSPELERIWGLPVGGFDGTVEAWRRLVHPDDRTSAHAGILRSLEDPTTASEFEYRIVRLDGAVRWIYAKVKTLCDAEGQAVRMVGVNLDITDRKEAQLRLERFAEELEHQVARRTQELVSSQDRLRTLATELNLTEQRERKRLATELHDHLQQMLVLGKIAIGQGKRVAVGIPACETAFQRVDGILSDALTYSRTLVAELCPPVLHEHGLVAGLKWLAEYMKNRQEQTVTVIAPEDRELHLPEDQRVLLFQSIRELLINAAKHAGTGEATIVIIERADQIQIEVRDHGQGFDLAAAAAAAAGTPHDGISSKFGLFSIQERMRAIGGSFEIQSSPGLGTTATLMLPLEKKPVEPLHASESVDKDGASLATAHSRGSCIRVLLVDDHLMVRQGLRAILDAYADIELVAEAGDGEEAVRLVGQWRPDVVVMDISMPRMNGIDATMQIKLRYQETIVIGLSVNAAGENQEAMERAGAVRLLTKEAAVEELYGTIKEAWRQKTLT